AHDRDAMAVDFEFEAASNGGLVEARTYRVHRGVNRIPRTGARTLSPVQLEELEGDEWRQLAGRVRSIDEEIERIVGLDYKAFTVCVVLPQGRFQEFLAGERKDRRDVLVELL